MILLKRITFLIASFYALCCFSFIENETLAEEKANEQRVEQSAAHLEFFETKIRPVLIKHCYKCHAADSKKVQGGLLLDSRKAIRIGGDSGSAVVPGKPEQSLILDALRHESFEMPPKKRLPDTIIADFEKWIADGAIDPREGGKLIVREEIDFEKGRQFWAFQPIANPEIPALKNVGWPKTDVDRFLLARMEKQKLQPAADAKKRDLLRRVYFDLTGLPPSGKQIESFTADRSPTAFEHVVDELLASPQFGERWGRHWLDVARYADSSGGGRVLLFQDAWRYRDYVIDAFNQDKPYDQFVREQIAGDLMAYDGMEQRGEQLTATGFLALGAHNYELQDKELLRMEVVDEQINVVGRAILGMTISCARCHDHKFDPIPTTDYYALAGIFRSTKSLVPGNVSGFVKQPLPLSSDKQKLLDAHLALVKEKQDGVKLLEEEAKGLGGSNLKIVTNPQQLEGLVIDTEDAIYKGKWTDSTSIKPFIGNGYRHSSENGATATFDFKIEEAGQYAVFISHTPGSNRSKEVKISILSKTGAEERTINQQPKPPIRGLFNLLGEFHFAPGKPAQVIVHAHPGGAIIADAVQLIPIDSQSKKVEDVTGKDLEQKRKEKQRLAKLKVVRKRLSTLKQELAKLTKEKPVSIENVMSVDEASDAGDFAVCVRGDVHHLGDPVKRGALSVLSLPSRFEIGKDKSGRLEFANWLTAKENPLTSRVYVNRVWHHLFGRGIVRTPDNFGAMGQRPTHPELLDYLASNFVANNYSTKSLIRQIVLSRAYQLGIDRSEKAGKIDPENNWYSSYMRRRLNAESLRDTILAFSGQLDRKFAGPSIKPGTSREFGYQFDAKRRAIYLPVFRNTFDELFEVFDFPNPNLVSGKRNESTLSTQALFLMNSQFVIEQSKFAADQMITMDFSDERSRITETYIRALGRPPTAGELKVTEQFLQQFNLQNKTEKLNAYRGICQTLISCIDFRFLK